MDDGNTRAEAYWEILSNRVNFHNKTVLDVGCGYGDFLWRYVQAGATKVDAVDIDKHALDQAEKRVRAKLNNDANKVNFHNFNFEYMTIGTPSKFSLCNDVAVCMSVLPYFENPRKVLNLLCGFSYSCAIIECPYSDGLKYIKNDKDMKKMLLESSWKRAVPIGNVNVDSSDLSRTIWMCR